MTGFRRPKISHKGLWIYLGLVRNGNVCKMGAKPGENNMNSQLQHLLHNNPHIWLGNEAQPKGEGVTGLPTGYPSLDAILPERGWPKNALIEMVTPQWGFGELQLLLPH